MMFFMIGKATFQVGLLSAFAAVPIIMLAATPRALQDGERIPQDTERPAIEGDAESPLWAFDFKGIRAIVQTTDSQIIDRIRRPESKDDFEQHWPESPFEHQPFHYDGVIWGNSPDFYAGHSYDAFRYWKRDETWRRFDGEKHVFPFGSDLFGRANGLAWVGSTDGTLIVTLPADDPPFTARMAIPDRIVEFSLDPEGALRALAHEVQNRFTVPDANVSVIRRVSELHEIGNELVVKAVIKASDRVLILTMRALYRNRPSEGIPDEWILLEQAELTQRDYADSIIWKFQLRPASPQQRTFPRKPEELLDVHQDIVNIDRGVFHDATGLDQWQRGIRVIYLEPPRSSSNGEPLRILCTLLATIVLMKWFHLRSAVRCNPQPRKGED